VREHHVQFSTERVVTWSMKNEYQQPYPEPDLDFLIEEFASPVCFKTGHIGDNDMYSRFGNFGQKKTRLLDISQGVGTRKDHNN
jgi:hypothetical protein